MAMPRNRHRNNKLRVASRLRVMEYTAWGFLFVALLGHTSPSSASGEMLRHRGGQAQVSRPLSREEIETAERRLAELGYWTGNIDGELDSSTRYAVTAFQKAEGRNRTGKLTRDEYAAILLSRPLLPRESHHAHVEVDLGRQILIRVDDEGKVSHILPISSGNGEFFTSEGYTRRAVTPVGRFTVYNKIKGWRKSPLGLLYYPNYIVGGIAIHGSLSVPMRPASHGCIRIPMFAAEEFSRLTPIGTVVVVHDDTPTSDPP